MNEAMKQIAIKYGTYLALLNISYILYAYLVDASVFTATWPGIVLFFLAIGFGIFAVGKFKQSNEGYATFKEAFSTYILTGIVATLIGTAFTVLLFSIIDPEFAVQTMDLIIETTHERFETSGMSDEQIEQIIGRIEGSNAFGIAGQLKSAAFSVMFNAIIALIVGAAMKKNNPAL
jgi:hypothetical protein